MTYQYSMKVFSCIIHSSEKNNYKINTYIIYIYFFFYFILRWAVQLQKEFFEDRVDDFSAYDGKTIQTRCKTDVLVNLILYEHICALPLKLQKKNYIYKYY